MATWKREIETAKFLGTMLGIIGVLGLLFLVVKLAVGP